MIQKTAAAFHILTYETVRSQGEEKPKTHDFGTIFKTPGNLEVHSIINLSKYLYTVTNIYQVMLCS